MIALILVPFAFAIGYLFGKMAVLKEGTEAFNDYTERNKKRK